MIFYIWQRNNLLPVFLCGVLWGKMEECGEGKDGVKEQLLPPFCQVKSTVFGIFDTVCFTKMLYSDITNTVVQLFSCSVVQVV